MKFQKKSGEKTLVPAGTHVAHLVRAIDMGSQYSERFDSTSRNIDLTWELCNEKKEFDGVEKPLVISRKVTQKIGPKATLGKMIKSWTGAPPADDFSINDLISTPCMVVVVHNDVSKDGETNTYANIDSVVAVPTGMPIPERFNDVITFDLDDFNQEVFDKLPEFMQDQIKETDEYAAALGEASGDSGPLGGSEDDTPDFLQEV